jgi:hypothetical protein
VSSKTTGTSPNAIATPLQINWLLPLSAAGLLGVILGAATRINAILAYQEKSIPAKLKSLGFDDDQTQAIMKRMAEQMDFKQVVEFDPTAGRAGLHSKEIQVGLAQHTVPTRPSLPFDWPAFWKEMPKGDAKYVVDNLLDEKNIKIIPADIRSIIESNRKKGIPDTDIVRSLKLLTDSQP